MFSNTKYIDFSEKLIWKHYLSILTFIHVLSMLTHFVSKTKNLRKKMTYRLQIYINCGIFWATFCVSEGIDCIKAEIVVVLLLSFCIECTSMYILGWSGEWITCFMFCSQTCHYVDGQRCNSGVQRSLRGTWLPSR